VLAIVHTFGLLQEAFPDRFPSERPFRFDWDKPSMYRCDVIRREVEVTKGYLERSVFGNIWALVADARIRPGELGGL
jgi:hypothetical protein